MAPRSPAPMAPRAPAAKAAPSQPSQPSPPPGDALADKLRAQRAAAERLAEQRVQAARERAESRMSDKPPAMPSRPRTPEPPPKPASGASRPKFSFADDKGNAEASAPTGRIPPGPLVPPRPALGGDRGQTPYIRPSGPSGSAPSYRTDTPPYRPIDPATGYPGTGSARYQPTYRGGYGSEPGLGGAPGRLTPPPVRRTPSYEPYARGPEPSFEPEPYVDDTPRLNRVPGPAPRGRGRPAVEEDQEDVFEDEAPRRRASARDYHSAYEQGDEDYEERGKRSRGPWLLLTALLAAAVATAGVVWYYNTNIKSGSTASQGQVPVVAAPDQPDKTVPEGGTDATGENPAQQKKQIYDRIVGEQEVGNDQVVPTEEVPVQPEPAAATGQDNGTSAIPAPSGEVPSTLEEPAPLPLPPPSSDQQGSLNQTGTEKLAATAPAEPAAIPVPSATEATAANTQQASPPAADEPAQTIMTEPEVATEQAPATAKKVVSTTKKKASQQAQNLGSEPVVLVPPAAPVAEAPADPGSITASVPVDTPAAPAEQQVKKKKTLLDLFSANGGSTAPAATGQKKVASVEPQQQPSTARSASAGGGAYYIQLGTFRTQAEARQESARVQSQHANVIAGLETSVVPANVAGGTRYGVRIGPVDSRDQATQVCGSLFAAGERDCLVRGQ
jgi:hypothetical protein